MNPRFFTRILTPLLPTMKTPRILATTIAALVVSATVHAQTWDGGGANDNLVTAANWNPDGVPISTADVIFGGNVRLTPNVSGAFTVNSLTFNNTAGAFVFGGGATLSLRAGGLVSNDTTTQTLNNAVSFGVAATSTINAANGDLVLNGAVTVPSTTLTLSGANDITFGSAILGTGAMTKTSSGTFTFSATANPISADFNLNGSNFTTVAASGTTQVFTSASTIAVNSGNLRFSESVILDGAQLTLASGAGWLIGFGKTVTVQNGGDVVRTGSYTGFGEHLVVTGAGSTFQVTGTSLEISGGSTLTVQSGGSVSSAGALGMSFDNGNDVALTVDGVGSVVSAGTGSTWGGSYLSGATNVTATFSNGAAGNYAGLQIARGINGTVAAQVLTGADITNSGNFSMGDTIANANGTLTVDGPGSTWTQTGTSTAIIGSTTGSIATLNVQNGGTFTTGTGMTTLDATGTLNINGGAFTANGAFVNGGAFSFISGTLNLLAANNLTIGTGGLLGANLTLLSDRALAIGGTTTIDAGRTLTLNGGAFRTGALVNNGALDFQRGTLGVTGAGGLNIGTGVLGSSVTLNPGANLEVTNTLTIAASASLNVSGGSFLGNAVSNSGSVRLNSGGFSTGGTFTNVTGGTLFVSDFFTVGGAVVNNAGARITLRDGTGNIPATGILSFFSNFGILTGDGSIGKPLTNQATGEVRAESGKTLVFTGGVGAGNGGVFSLQGGTMEFTTAITNAAAGFISGHGALHTAGLTNQGTIAISGGNADIFGDTTNSAGAKIITSGGSVTTFFDDVVHNGTEIRTSAGGGTVFFGAVSGAGPFTGTGTVFFEGDLRPGNSPASVLYEGDVVLGSAASLIMEIGGLNLGAQYDHLNIGGALHADGDLVLALLGGFTPQFGDTFDLFDAGAFAGDFDSISAPALAGGNAWDFSALKTTGSVTVVPEPGIGALLASALGFLGMRRGRIRGARRVTQHSTLNTQHSTLTTQLQ